MASSLTKQQLVEKACAQAGRGAELYSHLKAMLDIMLRSWGSKAKYPALRKVGSEITLSAGARTAALPSDLGAGLDHLLFVDGGGTILDLESDEFAQKGGYTSSGTGRPVYVTVDREAGLLRFNCVADQNYAILPIYFKASPSYADSDKVWFDNDDDIIAGLVAIIYEFKEDPREVSQNAKVDNKLANFRRGTIPMVGRIRLSKLFFK